MQADSLDLILTLQQQQQYQLYPGKNSSVTSPFMNKSNCFGYVWLLHSTCGFAIFPPGLPWLLKLYFLLRLTLIHSKCKNIPTFRLLCTFIKQTAAPSCHVIRKTNLLRTGFPTDRLTFEIKPYTPFYTCWHQRTVLEASVYVQMKLKTVLELR